MWICFQVRMSILSNILFPSSKFLICKLISFLLIELAHFYGTSIPHNFTFQSFFLFYHGFQHSASVYFVTYRKFLLSCLIYTFRYLCSKDPEQMLSIQFYSNLIQTVSIYIYQLYQTNNIGSLTRNEMKKTQICHFYCPICYFDHSSCFLNDFERNINLNLIKKYITQTVKRDLWYSLNTLFR